jgi:hypothetical protein
MTIKTRNRIIRLLQKARVFPTPLRHRTILKRRDLVAVTIKFVLGWEKH